MTRNPKVAPFRERREAERRRRRWHCPGCGSARWGHVERDAAGGRFTRCRNPHADTPHPRRKDCGVIDSRRSGRRAQDNPRIGAATAVLDPYKARDLVLTVIAAIAIGASVTMLILAVLS